MGWSSGPKVHCDCRHHYKDGLMVKTEPCPPHNQAEPKPPHISTVMRERFERGEEPFTKEGVREDAGWARCKHGMVLERPCERCGTEGGCTCTPSRYGHATDCPKSPLGKQGRSD